jgi:porin
MANDMAQSGKNGPPIFPVGALAVRVKYTSPGKIYLQGVLTDGVPGDPNDHRGTHIKLGNGDGTLSVVELGYTPQHDDVSSESTQQGGHEEGEYFNKTAIGFWRYSSRFGDPIEVDALGNPILRISRGVYVLAERTLAVKRDHPSQGLSGFVRFGTASKDIHQADWTGSLGLRYHGMLAKRDDDIAGIAITVSHASEKYRILHNAESRQTNVEATYRAQVNPWLALQPSLQYVADPNMDATLGNVWVVGARLEIVF